MGYSGKMNTCTGYFEVVGGGYGAWQVIREYSRNVMLPSDDAIA